MYKEMVVTVDQVQAGDLVMGTDGLWHEVVEVLPPFMPKSMYRVVTDRGYVECSGDHLFTVYMHGQNLGNFDTATLAVLNESFKPDLRLGREDGAQLVAVEGIEPKLSCCLVVKSEDRQFEILAKVEEE